MIRCAFFVCFFFNAGFGMFWVGLVRACCLRVVCLLAVFRFTVLCCVLLLLCLYVVYCIIVMCCLCFLFGVFVHPCCSF